MLRGSWTNETRWGLDMKKILCVSFLLFTSVILAQNDPATSGPAPIDLTKNQLVQKALADKDKALADAEADYQKKLDALNTERQKKIDAVKSNCVAALNRAATVATTLKQAEEAATIRALADAIAVEVPTPKVGTTSTPSKVATTSPAVPNMTLKVIPQFNDFTLYPDGTAVSHSKPAHWRIVGNSIEVKDDGGTWTNTLTLFNGKKWKKSAFKDGKLDNEEIIDQR